MEKEFAKVLIRHIESEIAREYGIEEDESRQVLRVLYYPSYAETKINVTILFKNMQFLKFSENYFTLQEDYKSYFTFILMIMDNIKAWPELPKCP